MTLFLVVLFIAGAVMFVWGLASVSRSRAAWMARSVAGVAHVVACKRNTADDLQNIDAYVITVRFDDTRGETHTTDLPSPEPLKPGEPVAVRFDPQRPATVCRTEHFKGTDKPLALIVFGALLVIISFAYAKD